MLFSRMLYISYRSLMANLFPPPKMAAFLQLIYYNGIVICADRQTDKQAGRQADRWHRVGVKIHEPTHEILVIHVITFSSNECLFKSAQMSRLARA